MFEIQISLDHKFSQPQSPDDSGGLKREQKGVLMLPGSNDPGFTSIPSWKTKPIDEEKPK